MGRLYNNQNNQEGRLYQEDIRQPSIQQPQESQQPQKKGNILSKIGGFLKGRFKKAEEKYGLGESVISYDEKGKRKVNEEVLRKQTSFALGFSPAGLKDVTGVSKMVESLKTSARKQFTEALAPTKQAFKQKAEKVVPELIKRRFTAFTRPGFHAKAGEELTRAGEELEKTISLVPEKAKLELRGIVNTLGKYRNKFTVVEDGKRIIIDEIGYQNAQKIQDVIKQFDDKVSFESLRRLRQIMDTMVTKGEKAFGRTLEEGSKTDATRYAANAIREEIAKKFPDVAKVNAEYSFWKNVDEILEETIRRTKGHGAPLGETIAEAAGAAAGFASGGVGKAITGALTFKFIKKILASTGFRTMSAISKDKIADLIAEGRFGAAMEIIRRTGITISSQLPNQETR